MLFGLRGSASDLYCGGRTGRQHGLEMKKHVNAQTMRIEFHPAADRAITKTPDDVVTVNLATRTIS
jgi:hypothetical protein